MSEQSVALRQSRIMESLALQLALTQQTLAIAQKRIAVLEGALDDVRLWADRNPFATRTELRNPVDKRLQAIIATAARGGGG